MNVDDGGAVSARYRPREPGLIDVVGWLGRHSWRMLLLGVLCAAAAYLVATQLPLQYTADVRLAPAQGSQPASGQGLSALAGLAGLDIGAPSDPTQIGLALLRSRVFLEAFILDTRAASHLLPEEKLSPNARALSPEQRQRAYEALRKRLSIEQDRTTGFVHVEVRAPRAEIAAEWANGLVSRLNQVLRARAVRRAQESRIYLEGQFLRTQIAEMRQLLVAMIANEMTTLMIARQPGGYGFEVIDPAVAPMRPSNTPPWLLAIAGAVFGLLLGAIWGVAVDAWRRR